MVLETVKTQHKGVDNRLSAALKSFIERIVKKAVKSQQFFGRITGAVIDNTKFVAPTAALVKSEQRKHNDERAKIEERCRKFVEAGTKSDPIAVSIPWKVGEELPTESSNDIKTSTKAY